MELNETKKGKGKKEKVESWFSLVTDIYVVKLSNSPSALGIRAVRNCIKAKIKIEERI